MTMKKIIAVLLAITPIFTFAACGNTSSDRADKPTTSTPASADKNTPSTNSNHPNLGKILVVYYSATGSTKAVAQTIAETVGANVFEIAPKDKYSSKDLDWTDSDSRVNVEHNDESKRDIALEKTTLDNWADYDTVFIGYPIWWAIAAWPANNFVKGNDFTGKTVIPFCTSASSGLGQSGKLLKKMAGTGDWQDGERFSSGASASDVTSWVNGLGLK